jgi:2-keto-4-pentenoate hydratase/2-oxohepta-3-ene-1,7-dioic acid hydratase in catechol pathway
VRIVRYTTDEPGDDAVGFGVVEGATGDGASVAAISPHPFGAFSFTGRRHGLSDVRLLAPMLPSKVVGIGRNYADHVREMAGPDSQPPERPIIFLKPSTAVVGPGEPVRLPADSERVDHEGELAVVIGRLCRDVPVSAALSVVLGYTCANDVTARDQQKADGQWARAKGHDTFCPIGPWVETELDPSDLSIRTTIDGDTRQSGRTSQLIHDVPSLISYVSSAMTLLPGDLLLTGTPAGVGPMSPGQRVSVTIEGIGTLTNPVVAR